MPRAISMLEVAVIGLGLVAIVCEFEGKRTVDYDWLAWVKNRHEEIGLKGEKNSYIQRFSVGSLGAVGFRGCSRM